jgi:3-dehydroquinate synthase
MMDRLTVELGTRSYPVLVGTGLIADAGTFSDALGHRSLVVTSEAVAEHHLGALESGLAGHAYEVIVLPDGDGAKTFAMVERVLDAAVTSGLGRDGTVVALGGGAIGDVAGFAAAIYHRGVGYIQVPTTLLAQVDSSVGGKTAINHASGKNLVGAFHQPRLVVADVGTLATLPDREYAAGLAEVVKYGLLDGPRLFGWLERSMDTLRARDTGPLAEMVYRCCSLKAAIVAEDEIEQGRRVTLNLGHSFGHALETAYSGALLHGEAVGLGCLMAAHLSRSLGWLASGIPARLQALLEAAGLPTALPDPVPDAERLLKLMAHDKKNLAGRIRLVLMRDLGEVEASVDYPHAALVLTLREFTGEAS